jgi:hypothetical protein
VRFLYLCEAVSVLYKTNLGALLASYKTHGRYSPGIPPLSSTPEEAGSFSSIRVSFVQDSALALLVIFSRGRTHDCTHSQAMRRRQVAVPLCGSSSAYAATVVWKRHGARFTDGQYSRAHDWTFDGGSETTSGG